MFQIFIFRSKNTDSKELMKVNFQWLQKRLLLASLTIVLFGGFYFFCLSAVRYFLYLLWFAASKLPLLVFLLRV